MYTATFREVFSLIVFMYIKYNLQGMFLLTIIFFKFACHAVNYCLKKLQVKCLVGSCICPWWQ